MNLFDPKFPADHRHDTEKNGDLLSVVFLGGTFGNFIKFFVDKFSRHTGDIDSDPFTDIATVHNIPRKMFSGKVQAYHPSFINDNRGETDLPICIPVPSTKKHFLYLHLAMLYRANDRKSETDDLWRKAVGEIEGEDRKKYVKEIIDLYQLKDVAHYTWLPKFIVRDWYKQLFLQPLEKTYLYRWFDEFTGHDFFSRQNVYKFDLEGFFNQDLFLQSMTELDNQLNLGLDFSKKDQMLDLFQKHLSADHMRLEAEIAMRAVRMETEIKTSDLQVGTEGFIYAELEKQYQDIQMPLGNRFFRDSDEIRQFIEHFPNWYRRKNPNLPQK